MTSPRRNPAAWLRSWALVTAWLATTFLAPSAATAAGRVIGLGVLSDGRVALLDGDRGLFLVDPKQRTMRRLGETFGLHSPVDIAVHRSPNGGDQIFVTTRLRSSSYIRGHLFRYDVAGKLTGEWVAAANEELSGIALEADGRTAYVSSPRQPIVYRIDLARNHSSPALVAAARSAETLGALALDAKRRRVVAADPFQGSLAEVRLDGSRSAVLVKGVGEPSALACQPGGDALLVADAEDARILVVDLGAAAPKATLFAAVKGLDQPHGLAVGADGTIWVAGYRDGTLFQLSSKGSLLASFRPKLIDAPAHK